MDGVSDDVCEVVITAPNPAWLADFAHELIESRLCASAHLAPIRSLYRWQGQMHDKTEARVALHTRASLVPQIISRTQREHPYEVPGLVTLPIRDGNRAYLQWILDETQEP